MQFFAIDKPESEKNTYDDGQDHRIELMEQEILLLQQMLSQTEESNDYLLKQIEELKEIIRELSE